MSETSQDMTKLIEQLGTFLDIPPSERKPFYSIDEVHNLIAAASLVGDQRGYERGREQGLDDGYVDGQNFGYDEGRSDGYEMGYDDGFEAAGGEQA